MDLAFITLDAALWLSAVGMALGCLRLQGRGNRP
jgi:hypothetical protein